MARTAVPGAEVKKSAQQTSRMATGAVPALLRKSSSVYRLMLLSRRTDDREIVLKSQQKVFFQISGAGHEALLVAAGLALRPGYDWFFPYYRDRALSLTLGTTVEEQLLQAVGAAADPASGGRQMPSHWSDPKLHIVTPSSSTATQCLQAVGCAEAALYLTQHPEAAKPGDPEHADYRHYHTVDFHGDEVVYVSIGEGATSQGEFWESLNIATNRKLPVVYVVEDNGYAISVPVEVNTPGGNISRLLANFPNFHFEEVDGTDPIACTHAFAPPSPTAAPARALPWSTATSPAPTPTPIPTTPASIAPSPKATPKPCATPSRIPRLAAARKNRSTPKPSTTSRSRSDDEVRPPPNALCRAAPLHRDRRHPAPPLF